MLYPNVYYFNGNAYAGKSTMVHLLAEKYGGIECEENYHSRLDDLVEPVHFPNLSYTKYLKDWGDFVRRTPDAYEAWVNGNVSECTELELRILKDIAPNTNKKVFVDTNIPVEVLREISDTDHVMIMLADPAISVKRFFERPDKEKQFLYQLLLKEPDPEKAIANFRECISRINTPERVAAFENSGFKVLHRDDSRSVEQTLALVEKALCLA